MILKSLTVHNFQEQKIIKQYKFNDYGLNVILGDKRTEVADTNGVGKTNFVKQIHYLLGRDFSKENIPGILLENNILTCLKIYHEGQYMHLARLFTDTQYGYILYGAEFSYQIGDWERKSNKKFREFINEKFSLTAPNVTFAALREYIIRDEKKGYASIVNEGRNALVQYRTFLSLFDLPNYYEEELKKLTTEINKIIDEKDFISSYKISPEKLKIEQQRIKKEIEILEKQIQKIDLREFSSKNAERYTKIKESINKIQSIIFKLDFTSKQYQKNIDDLERKQKELKKLNDLEGFYEQMSVYFPDNIKKNFKEIQNFYVLMRQDRGNYFKIKLEEINLEREKYLVEKHKLEEELAVCTKVLNNTTFIEDLSGIQVKLNHLQEELAKVNIRLLDAERVNELNVKIQEKKLERSKEIVRYDTLFKSFNDQIVKIHGIFANIVEKTYNDSGYLTFYFDNTDRMNGKPGRIKLECHIPEEESFGRHNSKVRAVDLTWLIYRVQKMLPITFLVHDGSFSATDNEKNFNMLRYAHEILSEYKRGQYIVTLNRKDVSEEALAFMSANKLIIADLNKDKDENRFFGFRFTKSS
ncbi:DUF2326 domain-containing protein [Bacillus cereus]|uniref:DUF2326 domain-containing protein n=1 Tax=Bacillus cereus TaxID=1396 RepID=UPI002D7727AA|nr:DUF2326 domain-containing protein [Bacillus cereus]